jgi:L-lactate dehydrogenase complex protein LldG
VSSEREKFLNRIKTSLRNTLLPASSPDHPGSFTGYTYRADAPVEQRVDHFTQELQALSGQVHVVQDPESVVSVILEILQSHQAKRIVAWDDEGLGLPGLSGALTEAGIMIEDSHISADSFDRQVRMVALDGVLVGLTGAQGGLADTGTLALVSGPGRGRLASLLPPVHIALLPAQKLYPSLPAFLAAHPAAATEGSNLVFITGPSRTADIELTLSMGVHGPKEIHVIITQDYALSPFGDARRGAASTRRGEAKAEAQKNTPTHSGL